MQAKIFEPTPPNARKVIFNIKYTYILSKFNYPIIIKQIIF